MSTDPSHTLLLESQAIEAQQVKQGSNQRGKHVKVYDGQYVLGYKFTIVNGKITAVAVPVVPGVPTNVTAVGGDTQAVVSFKAPVQQRGQLPILDYTVTSSPGGKTATGVSSPLTVTTLTNGTPYTFTVKARNSVGQSSASAASNSVTPA
jgi:hypothetical protein